MSTVVFKKYGAITAEWGTRGAGALASFGIIKAAERKNGSQTDQLLDEDGCTVGVIYFDTNDVVNVTIVCKSGMTNPLRGDAINVCGLVSALIGEWTTNWDNKALKSLKLTCTRWENLLV